MPATLENLKLKLEAPETDHSLDALYNGLLKAAERSVADLTRFAVKAEAARIDTLERIYAGSTFYLTRRPVSALTSIEGRAIGSGGAWTTLTSELADAQEGMVAIVDSGGSFYQPIARPSWSRWRRPRYDLVRVTYAVTVAAMPEDVVNAIEDLAAYWYDQAKRGNRLNASAAGISEAYDPADMPPHVRAVLSKYDRRRAVACL